MNKIDTAIKSLERKELLNQVKNSKFGITFMLVIISLLSWGYLNGPDKTIKTIKVSGYVVGAHQTQSQLGSTESNLSVKLNTGKNVFVTLPSNTSIQTNCKIELYKNISEKGRVSYQFIQYIKGANKTLQLNL